MTGSLRRSARNPVAAFLMGVLILVFLVIGVGGGARLPDMLSGARADSVVTAGRHAMSASEFRRIFEQQKQRLNQQANQTFADDFLVKNGFDVQLLQQIEMDQAEAEMLARAGVVPDPTLIEAQIKQIPVAFDKVTGKFSPQQFTQFLAAQGLTLRQVQTDLSDEIAEREYALSVASDFQMPRAYAALSALGGLESRDVSYFVLSPSVMQRPAAPTDAQLMAFEKAHAAALTEPEMRVITIARFSTAALLPGVKVAPADVEKAFEAQKSKLSTEERRTIIQIPVKTAAQGADAAARLKRGEDPAAIARGVGAEPVIYDDKPRTAFADKTLAKTAFSMKAGDVVGPVQGALGMAALEVTKITPASTATLASARPKLEADLRQKAAQDKAYAQSEAFDTAHQSGASLALAAQKAGVATLTVGPFSEKGLGEDGKPVALLNDKIIKAAFGAARGEDTEVEDAGSGEYFALRVDKVIPPMLPPLDQNRALVAQAYTSDALRTAFRAKAEQLVAQIKGGAPIATVAAGVGAPVQRLSDLQLVKAQQYQSLGRDFLGAAFGAKPGQAFAAGAPGGAYIGKVDASRPADGKLAAGLTNALRGRIGNAYVRDLLQASKTASLREVRASINRDVALKALNIDPKTVAAPKAATPSKAK